MDIKRIFLATGLSAAILIAFDYFVPQHASEPQQSSRSSQHAGGPRHSAPTAARVQETAGEGRLLPVAQPGGSPSNTRPIPHQAEKRIAIEGSDATGSLSLRGARLDDLVLTHYRETLHQGSPMVRLLEPRAGAQPSFISVGWKASEGSSPRLPDAQTDWQSADQALTPTHPVELFWNNGEGLVFRLKIELKRRYLFSITQSVENHSGKLVSLTPYAFVERSYKPIETGGMIVHEGPLSVVDERLNEESFKTMRKGGDKPDHTAWSADGTGGWAGITDRYWLTALIPDQKTPVVYRYKYVPNSGDGSYIVDAVSRSPVEVRPGATESTTGMIFAGAKEVDLLDDYTRDYHIPFFYKAVDFGWFAFLTRPMFHILHWLFSHVGNFGVALLILTLIIKLILYPLATKSFASMARMRALAPRIQSIREHTKDNQLAMNQQIMALYKEEGVNPAGGCLPLLIQAPVAFCLYKVLNITIEMRHAPFYGWVRDLSAPDPTSFVNLFGLLPFRTDVVPQMLQVGVWPILFGITIWLMQRQSSISMDPAQQKIMQFMPIIYTFFLGKISAGIVIYYTWNNILTYAQQKLIQHQIDKAPRRLRKVAGKS